MYNKKRYIFCFLSEIARTFSYPQNLWIVNIKACLNSLFKTPKIEKDI